MENKKKEKIKIDIILPNYNSSQFINKTVQSILKQTYKNWKLIIVDDFSDAETKSKLKKISKIYVNRGPGSFAGIRNSLSVVKAIHLVNKTDYYCFSFDDFTGEKDTNYTNIPHLCEKFEIKKNLINPIYLS